MQKEKAPGRNLLILPLVLSVLASCNYSGKNQEKVMTMDESRGMNTFVIEREIEHVGSSTDEELKEASKKSISVVEELGPDIEWEHSYVVDDKLYCVFKAKDKSLIREHARKVGVPTNSISKVSAIMDPHSQE